MAFPLVALLTAAASDLQQRRAASNAEVDAANAQRNKIMRMRAQELGGSPYIGMSADLDAQMGEIRRQAEASRNNYIGKLLGDYLNQPSAPEEPKQRELIGGAPTIDDLPGVGNRSGGAMVDDLFGNESYDLIENQPSPFSTSGIGFGDNMGKAQMDPWDKDPWGDAGY